MLISDFYAPYDAVACAQQKCLIHLIRDFNHDIQRNPWDEELKALAADFGAYCGPLLSPSDRYGLSQRHLRKHRQDVDAFFHAVSGRLPLRSHRRVSEEIAHLSGQALHVLALRWGPLNNNHAEHAVKRFAYYREIADGYFSETATGLPGALKSPRHLQIQGCELLAVPPRTREGHRRLRYGQGLAQRPADDRLIPEGLRWRVGNGLAAGIRSSNNPIGRNTSKRPARERGGWTLASLQRTLAQSGRSLAAQDSPCPFAAHAGLRGYLCVQHVSLQTAVVCKPVSNRSRSFYASVAVSVCQSH